MAQSVKELQMTFACPRRHVTAAHVHTFMVIDRSGSMASKSIKPDNRVIRSHPQIHGLDNVLGVVYEAAYKYICERSARAPQDLLTFLPFNDGAQVTCLGSSLQSPDGLLNTMMAVKPDGGTTFYTALSTAYQTLQQVSPQPFICAFLSS
jgi:hypothetical protein